MKQLKESIGAHVIGIWEILKEIGLPQQAKGLEIPVAIHDACGARGDAQTQDMIRQLLSDMGCTVEDTEYSRDYLMELINSVAMQLQSDFDDGDIGHPTGKVNEFIKENFQVDLLNIEQENKINFSLQM